MTPGGSTGGRAAPRVVSSKSLEDLTRHLARAVPGPTGDTDAREALKPHIAQAMAALKAHEVHPDVMSAPQDRVACIVQTALAEHATDHHLKLIGLYHHVRFDRDPADFDPRYYRVVLGTIEQKLGADKCRFDPPDAALDALAPHARMTLIGDFGTGLYGAPYVKEAVEAAAANCAAGTQNVFVHLGDVYYTGTEREVEERFLPFFPSVDGAVRRACNGNHDMYSGGAGYARILGEFEQPSNCFGFRNDDWVVLGIDTADAQDKEGDISAVQLEWLKARVAERGGRSVVVLAHHPAFTQAKPPSTELLEKLRPLLEAQSISAWYAGHEHLCAIYDRYEPWVLHARCLGHGGLPDAHPNHVSEVVAPDARGGHWINVPDAGGGYDSAWYETVPDEDAVAKPRAIVLDGDNPYVTDKAEQFSPNGYGVLEFEGKQLTESIHAPGGQLLYERTLFTA
jgi:hypothetical protein